MTRRSLAVLLAAATLAPASLRAQDDGHWRFSYFPVVAYSSNEGFGGGVRLTETRRAPWDATYPHSAQFGLTATIATSGSYKVLGELTAPGLAPDWRFEILAGGVREARFRYFGLGDTTSWDRSLESGADKYYYRTDRRRLLGDIEVSRRLHGHLWLAAAATASHVRFAALSGNSVFLQQYPGGGLTEDDATGRLSLVFDTRDNEYDTHRGLLLETSALAGSAGSGYRRYTTVLRGWKAFGEYATWWVDGRILASTTDGTPPLDARFFIPTWEGVIRSYGGAATNRGLTDQRYAGRDVLGANLEVHRDLINVGLYGALSVHAFADAGRVFEDGGFRLTTDGFKAGGGAGFALRFGRTAIYTFNFAGGPDGFVFTLGSGWMF